MPARWTIRIVAHGLIALAVATALGCTTRTSTTSPEASPGTPAIGTEAPTVPSPTPSEGSLAYASEIGGIPHEGEELFLVVGASFASENAARTALDEALPVFGDMQPYFIVQHSDNFEGMEPGRWLVVEAYRDTPSEESLDFGRRAFPNLTVSSVVVRTRDPIPVYEDLVGL
jgi:hypothetical protein